MLINCYYYAPHNHSMLSSHVRDDLSRMRDIGTDAVSFCVQESQLTNWHWKRIDNFVTMAHAAGLKVHAVPNRWAGLVAGWIDGFSSFTVMNERLLTESAPGVLSISGEMPCCVNKPGVEEHLLSSLETMLSRFDFDGVIWDEPHADWCRCERCRDVGIDSFGKSQDSFSAFLDKLSLAAKELKPGLCASVFVQPDHDSLLNSLLGTAHLDFIGSDGHLRSPSHRMHRMKTTIFEAHAKYQPLIKEAGKKSFFLLEGQRHRDEDLDDYLAKLDSAFSLPMDHLMYYYCAHEMSPDFEERMNEATWKAVARLAALKRA